MASIRLIQWAWAAWRQRFSATAPGRFRLVEAKKFDFEHSAKIAVFFPETPATRASNLRDVQNPNSELYPNLGARRLGSAVVGWSSRLPEIVVENELLIPQAAPPGPWRLAFGEPHQGLIVQQRGFRTLVDLSQVQEQIETGIAVGAWSPHNWFHWLIDILPSVFLARSLPSEYDNFPILVPAVGLEKP